MSITAELQAQFDDIVQDLETQHLDEMRRARREHAEDSAIVREEADRQVGREQVMRIAAQRGLVPYVRSLQAFDKWLLKHPELRSQLEPKLRELGLWEIKLGYNPDEDFNTSVASAHGTFALLRGRT